MVNIQNWDFENIFLRKPYVILGFYKYYKRKIEVTLTSGRVIEKQLQMMAVAMAGMVMAGLAQGQMKRCSIKKHRRNKKKFINSSSAENN